MMELVTYNVEKQVCSCFFADQTIQADKSTILFPNGDALKFVDEFIRKAPGMEIMLASSARSSETRRMETSGNSNAFAVDTAPVIPKPCPTNPSKTDDDSFEYDAGTF